jgi:hypothetical protein
MQFHCREPMMLEIRYGKYGKKLPSNRLSDGFPTVNGELNEWAQPT